MPVAALPIADGTTALTCCVRAGNFVRAGWKNGLEGLQVQDKVSRVQDSRSFGFVCNKQ